MTSIERTATVPVPPAGVWEVLADFGGISRWADVADHSCLLTEQEAGVGATRRIQTGRTTLVETVVVWEPDERLAYTIGGLPPVIRSATNTWTLAPASSGTAVSLRSEVDAGPRPPQRVVARAVARRLAATSTRMLADLAEHLDRQELAS